MFSLEYSSKENFKRGFIKGYGGWKFYFVIKGITGDTLVSLKSIAVELAIN